MKPPEATIPFAGSTLGAARHACAFFHSPAEEYQVLLPFIKDGFECGDRAWHLVDPDLRQEHLRQLESRGIDVARAEQTGQLKVSDWEETYLQNGRFDQHKTLALIEETLKEGARKGFRISRGIGHMEWALEHKPGVADLIEYEARLNYILPHYEDAVICVYGLTRFSGAIVVDVLRTHPMVVIGGFVHENPFFVPPDVFLRGMRERRAQSVKLGD